MWKVVAGGERGQHAEGTPMITENGIDQLS